MNEQIKNKMEELRQNGLGYKKIAKALSINVNTISNYFRRKRKINLPVYCKNCGYKIINMNKMGRKKKFCCTKCKLNYYKSK